MGNVHFVQGALPAALESYWSANRISERLTRADPSNTGLQHDLAASFSKTARVLLVQRDLPPALESLRASNRIFESSSDGDASNCSRQADRSHVGMGDAVSALGDRTAALKSYLAANRIFESLHGSDPGDEKKRGDLGMRYRKLGRLYASLGSRKEALEAFNIGRGLLASIAVQSSSEDV
jgi:tetratricopeptide (TPR) repeat protein